MQQVVPWIARWVHKVELVLTPGSLQHMNAIKRQPFLVVCNHPTFHDPLVIFLLSGRLRMAFHFLAAFEQFKGKQGWFYQRIGAYSIRRGMADRDSISQTIKLLSERDCRLVIFPEGGCSFQNDTVMPLRAGGVQMSFQAMARKVKHGEPIYDFYIVPISLKYRYTGDMRVAIAQSLHQLEQALNITTPHKDFYQRLRAIADQVIRRCEEEYGITTTTITDWNQRILTLKAGVLEQCERRLGLASAAGEPVRERVYRIRHILSHRQNTLLPDGTDGWDVLGRATMRLLNFDAIYDGYVAAKPTPERFLDTLIRFEREVFEIDQPKPKGHRKALLKIGQPVNLKDYFEDYLGDRSKTVEALLQHLQQTMQKNLDELAEGSSKLLP
ncbi:MAG: 1-acyl-sn-glycerol-3-phosphate acyltransferase [Oculatellaceae cyanobacterium Prado106]|nr:1-acyl-sn-glycerol-3-phosphate acyltransferase [Oculatellaceae cyanobacterium Prado106]